MSNIVSSVGVSQESLRRKIGDMVPGDIGYTVEWAIRCSELDEDFMVHDQKLGTASMRVECVAPGQYNITYEEPVYRNPLIEWEAEARAAKPSFLDQTRRSSQRFLGQAKQMLGRAKQVLGVR